MMTTFRIALELLELRNRFCNGRAVIASERDIFFKDMFMVKMDVSETYD